MDQNRFDALARALAGASSRRAALAAALATVLPLAGEAKGKHDKVRDRDRKADRYHAGDRERAGGDRPAGSAEASETPDRGPSGAACLAVGQPCGRGSGKRGKKGKNGTRGKGRKAVPCTSCCSRHAVTQANGRKRCACKAAGAAANNAAQCCSGRISAGGFCGACDPGLTECADACVDTESDGANCGRCGNACADGQRCADGACVCDGESCPQGCCAGDECRLGTGNDACGTGGAACAACAPPDTCGGGAPGTPKACGCTPDANACAGRNCGTVTDRCGAVHRCGPDACSDGYSCAGNVCTCPNGNAVCEGDCCAAGEVCRNGSGDCCAPQGQAAACAGRECGTAVDSCTGATYDCAPAGDDCTRRGYSCTPGGQCSCPGGRAVCPASGAQSCCAVGEVCRIGGDGTCCEPEPPAATCAGRCGPVDNTCGVEVNCSALCEGCCDGATCRVAGEACGPSTVCLAGGACAACGGAAQPCCAGNACDVGGTCAAGTCVLAYGAACNGDAACASGRCVADANGDRFCGCAAAADCAGGANAVCLGNGTCTARCVNDPILEFPVCPLPGCDSCGGGELDGISRSCRSVASQCLPALGTCGSSADCPFGTSCSRSGNPVCCPGGTSGCTVCISLPAACIA